jgi:hypothetical protein
MQINDKVNVDDPLYNSVLINTKDLISKIAGDKINNAFIREALTNEDFEQNFTTYLKDNKVNEKDLINNENDKKKIKELLADFIYQASRKNFQKFYIGNFISELVILILCIILSYVIDQGHHVLCENIFVCIFCISLLCFRISIMKMYSDISYTNYVFIGLFSCMIFVFVVTGCLSDRKADYPYAYPLIFFICSVIASIIGYFITSTSNALKEYTKNILNNETIDKISQ